MTKTVRIENLADAVTAELVNYQQEVTDDLKKEIRTVSRETVQQIKNTSPKESGRYAKGWKFRVIFENENDLWCVSIMPRSPSSPICWNMVMPREGEAG